MQTAVLLHNIRSAHNVGAIFRTAEAAGVAHIYLTGYTPTPIDRFGRRRTDLAKTALQADTFLSWQYRKDPRKILAECARLGWSIVGVEQDGRAIPFKKFKPKQPTLFIFGNEVRGMSRALRARCDYLLEIPMRGKKESLNVSVAAGIILFTCVSTKRRPR
jgi:tRNA G18 (ribose-2'-O)-methylase SpoU